MGKWSQAGNYGATRKAAHRACGRDHQKAWAACRWRRPLSACQQERLGSRIFRWKRDGRLRDMGLGPLNTISLAEARDRALACRKLTLDGGDPIEERRGRRQAARLQTAKAMTFRECAEAYIAAHQSGWKNSKHAAQWPATLANYVYPVLGSLPVQAVDVGLVMKALEPIWKTKNQRRPAGSAAASVGLDWASARGYRQGRTRPGGVAISRTYCRGGQRWLASSIMRHCLMTNCRASWQNCAHEGVAARALEFAILTAVRTGEVIGATWAEIDLEGCLSRSRPSA